MREAPTVNANPPVTTTPAAQTAARRKSTRRARRSLGARSHFDFFGGAFSTFNGSIHVAEPSGARVLSCEENPTCGPLEPLPPARIVGGIEIRVSTASPWIVLPRDHL